MKKSLYENDVSQKYCFQEYSESFHKQSDQYLLRLLFPLTYKMTGRMDKEIKLTFRLKVSSTNKRDSRKVMVSAAVSWCHKIERQRY